jgi:hypothetical protein
MWEDSSGMIKSEKNLCRFYINKSEPLALLFK